MTIYALWHGGYSYTPGSIDEGDLEVFPSVQRAGQALRDRYDSNGCRTVPFVYADGRTERTLLPAVDAESTSMDVYLYDPRETAGPWPNVRLTLGPRLGVRRERY